MKQSILTSLAALLILGALSAQNASAQLPTLFEERDRALSIEKYNSGSSAVNENSGRKAVFDDMRWKIGAADAAKNCSGASCPEVPTDAPTPIPGGTTYQTVNTAGPMRTHADILAGQGYTQQQFSFMSSPWVLADITFNYLDSGVFGGMNSAYQKSQLAMANRTNIENMMFNQLEYAGDAREVVGAGYVGCVKHYQGLGWTAAQDKCLEDAPMPNGSAGFGGSTGGAQVNWIGTNPNATDTPLAGDPPNTPVKLTDLLFYPISHASGGADITTLRDDFNRLFGDKTFEMASASPGSAKEIKVADVEPTLSASAFDKQLHDTTWETLLELMRGYCEFYNYYHDVDSSSHNPFAIQYDCWTGPWGICFPYNIRPDHADFWAKLGETYNGVNGPVAATFIDLTTSTFEFNPLVGDALFSLFLKTQDIQTDTGGGTPSPGRLTCASPKRARVGPSTKIEARMVFTNS